VICHESILPVTIESAAAYEALPTKNLGRDSTVEDICDFVVEYIHSDVLVCNVALQPEFHPLMACHWGTGPSV
jgi:hypothetical protein